MARNPRTTIHDKERWLLDRPSEWNYFHELAFDRQKSLLNSLFRRMRELGFYAPSTAITDGRVSLRSIIERLLAQRARRWGNSAMKKALTFLFFTFILSPVLLVVTANRKKW